MSGRFGAEDLTTALVLALTLWVLIARYRGVVESNYPVFYYVAVVAYSLYFQGVLDPSWVYSGVVCALLLRFEFMGGFFLKVIRVIDIAVLLVLAYWLFSAINF